MAKTRKRSSIFGQQFRVLRAPNLKDQLHYRYLEDGSVECVPIFDDPIQDNLGQYFLSIYACDNIEDHPNSKWYKKLEFGLLNPTHIEVASYKFAPRKRFLRKPKPITRQELLKILDHIVESANNA